MASLQHIWRIPSITDTEKKLLCHGFVRNNYDGYITIAIIDLFSCYYSKDVHSINNIKNAKHKQSFISPIFAVESFKWFFELYPNSCNDSTKGDVMLFICLASITPKISKIITTYKLSLIETNTEFTERFTFHPHINNLSYSGWKINTLKFHQLKCLNTISIKLEMTPFIILDKSQQIVNNNDISISCNKSQQTMLILPNELKLPLATFKWEINDKSMINNIKNSIKDQLFQSPIYSIGSFKWTLRFYPKGDSETIDGVSDLFLKLMSIPPTISQILVQYKLFLKETGSIFRNHNSIFSRNHLSEGWDDGVLTTKALMHKNIKSLTFFIDLSIFEIYDNNEDMIDIENDQQYNILNLNKAKQLTLPTAIYEWKINDEKTLKLIKNAVNVATIASPIFIAHGLKFYCSFSPNGSRASRKGTLNIFLTIASFKTVDIQYIVKFDIFFVESNKTHTVYSIFKLQWNGTGATDWPLKTNDIKDINQFTFILRITLVDVYKGNEIITDKYYIDNKLNENHNNVYIPKLIVLPSEMFQWKISQNLLSKMKIADNGMVFESEKFEMFQLGWDLKLYPLGRDKNDIGYSNLCIHILSLPSNTAIISMRYTVSIIQTGLTFVRSAIFGENRMIESWGSERLETNTFIGLKSCTIQLVMELVDIYDDGRNVTDKYL